MVSSIGIGSVEKWVIHREGVLSMSIKQILFGIIICFAFASCYKALYTKAYLIGEPPKKTGIIFDGEKVMQNIFGWDVYIRFSSSLLNTSRVEALKDSFRLLIDCTPNLGEAESNKIFLDSVQIHSLKNNSIILPTVDCHYSVKGSESIGFNKVYIGPDEPKIELTVVVTVTFPSGEKRTERKTVTMKRYERVEHGWIVD
jgi:hypothetical protein